MALDASQRRASATVPASKGHPSGRFPMPDVKHAKLALQVLPQAKNLPSSQAAQIKARAARMLAGQRVVKGQQGG
jgi:hypothetical protein